MSAIKTRIKARMHIGFMLIGRLLSQIALDPNCLPGKDLTRPMGVGFKAPLSFGNANRQASKRWFLLALSSFGPGGGTPPDGGTGVQRIRCRYSAGARARVWCRRVSAIPTMRHVAFWGAQSPTRPFGTSGGRRLEGSLDHTQEALGPHRAPRAAAAGRSPCRTFGTMHGAWSIVALLMTLLRRAACASCLGGGSGYAMAFDGLEGQTIALAPEREGQATSAVTVEYWVNIMDVHLSQQPVFAYSVYSVAGRYDQGGAPYENANELVFIHAPTYLRAFRATSSSDVDFRQPYEHTGSWHHVAFVWSADPRSTPNGQIAVFFDGRMVANATVCALGACDMGLPLQPGGVVHVCGAPTRDTAAQGSGCCREAACTVPNSGGGWVGCADPSPAFTLQTCGRHLGQEADRPYGDFDEL
jgi:hypothetical protein